MPPRKKATVNYLIIDNLEQPPDLQTATIVTVEGRTDTEANRHKALEKALELWEEGALNGFPNGLTIENVIFSPPSPPDMNTVIESGELPIQKAAREVCQLVDLMVNRSEAIAEATPLLPILEAAEKGEKLTAEQQTQAKDKGFGKTLTKLANAVADHQEFAETPGVWDSLKMIIAVIKDDRLITPEEINPPSAT